MRRCRKCELLKPLEEFPKHRLRMDGRDYRCKLCTAANGKKWYQAQQVKTDRLYSTWVGMKGRCFDKTHQNYPLYGGRGITVCQEWIKHFCFFELWSKANGYRDGLQLDRIDNDKGYQPDNCRFVTRSENMKNKAKRDVPLRNYTKLTKDKVLEIRRLLSEGQSQRSIAKKFGVCHESIGSIFRGKSWKEVS